jgi:hypothetical protein
VSESTSHSSDPLETLLPRGTETSVLVITDDPEIGTALNTGTPTTLDAATAERQRDDLPHVDLAVVDAEAAFADGASAVHLISRLRDVYANQVLVIGARQTTAALDRHQLVGLGFRRWATTGEGGQRRRWYEFSLADYKVTPDWLSPRHWANPELWDRYRW